MRAIKPAHDAEQLGFAAQGEERDGDEDRQDEMPGADPDRDRRGGGGEDGGGLADPRAVAVCGDRLPRQVGERDHSERRGPQPAAGLVRRRRSEGPDRGRVGEPLEVVEDTRREGALPRRVDQRPDRDPGCEPVLAPCPARDADDSYEDRDAGDLAVRAQAEAHRERAVDGGAGSGRDGDGLVDGDATCAEVEERPDRLEAFAAAGEVSGRGEDHVQDDDRAEADAAAETGRSVELKENGRDDQQEGAERGEHEHRVLGEQVAQRDRGSWRRRRLGALAGGLRGSAGRLSQRLGKASPGQLRGVDRGGGIAVGGYLRAHGGESLLVALDEVGRRVHALEVVDHRLDPRLFRRQLANVLPVPAQTGDHPGRGRRPRACPRPQEPNRGLSRLHVAGLQMLSRRPREPLRHEIVSGGGTGLVRRRPPLLAVPEQAAQRAGQQGRGHWSREMKVEAGH